MGHADDLDFVREFAIDNRVRKVMQNRLSGAVEIGRIEPAGVP